MLAWGSPKACFCRWAFGLAEGQGAEGVLKQACLSKNPEAKARRALRPTGPAASPQALGAEPRVRLLHA